MRTIHVYSVTVAVEHDEISEDEFYEYLHDRLEQAMAEVPAILMSFDEMTDDTREPG